MRIHILRDVLIAKRDEVEKKVALLKEEERTMASVLWTGVMNGYALAIDDLDEVLEENDA